MSVSVTPRPPFPLPSRLRRTDTVTAAGCPSREAQNNRRPPKIGGYWGRSGKAPGSTEDKDSRTPGDRTGITGGKELHGNVTAKLLTSKTVQGDPGAGLTRRRFPGPFSPSDPFRRLCPKHQSSSLPWNNRNKFYLSAKLESPGVALCKHRLFAVRLRRQSGRAAFSPLPRHPRPVGTALPRRRSGTAAAGSVPAPAPRRGPRSRRSTGGRPRQCPWCCSGCPSAGPAGLSVSHPGAGLAPSSAAYTERSPAYTVFLLRPARGGDSGGPGVIVRQKPGAERGARPAAKRLPRAVLSVPRGPSGPRRAPPGPSAGI
ncbi:uncharacterized protein LOC143691902 [Agelaius phoeniceus]|uniref:uncharacterized protein LOC143691902 n=1 Tax=Agelaius phoeniceus TaxID=39638 RepID=UPI004055018A